MDVIVKFLDLNIFIFTEWFPRYATNKWKFNFNRLFYESKMHTLGDLYIIKFLFDLSNSALITSIYSYMK